MEKEGGYVCRGDILKAGGVTQGENVQTQCVETWEGTFQNIKRQLSTVPLSSHMKRGLEDDDDDDDCH